MTPVVAQHDLALPAIQSPAASAAVQLAGFDSPITELLGTLGALNGYVFEQTPGVPLPAPYTGTVSSLGVLPQIIKDALPVVRQLGLNGSDYLYNSINGFNTSATLLSEGVWNAAGDLLSLNVPGAISTLVTAVQAAGANALAAGNYVLQGVITRATAVVNNLVPILSSLPQVIINQALVVVGSVVQVVTNTVAAFGGANPFENAWNAVVDGLLGPTGIPGAVLGVTIGVGVPAPAPISAFVPSVRTVLSSVVKAVQSGLATANPAPPPATAVSPAAPSASSLRAAAAETSTPAVESTKSNDAAGGSATAGDNNGGSSAGSSEGSGSGASKSTGGSARAAHKAAASKSSE
ncbi:hypothetical protein OG976_06325 [Mycobacterium sp. NBC_00419]|uniref:hypothetical protein n=1 Tax=Mycobacterium sp. NBC_00419 TaxID=2975989 RepID=UPI002E1A749B